MAGSDIPPEHDSLPSHADEEIAQTGAERIEELGAPSPAVSQTCFLRGFDPQSGLATFVHVLDGSYREFTVEVPEDDPLYRRNYETLIACLNNDKGPHVLQVRVSMPTRDGDFARLLLASPVSKDLETRFKWKGVELHWSRTLDHAVDVDFDRYADGHASSFLATLLEPQSAEAKFSPVRQEAKKIFLQEAAAAGVAGDLDGLFEKFAPKSLGGVIQGTEHAKGATRAVRYDIRYTFKQQSAHVPSGDQDALASALANFAAQKGVAVFAAHQAVDKIPTGDAHEVTSLAQAHQNQLIADSILLAPNPSLDAHRESYAAYSFESVRNAVAGNLAGMMDAAGIQAARGELDMIEYEKANGTLGSSKHLQVLAGIPEAEKNHSDPLVRAGAYLKTSELIEADYRVISKERVADAQRKATPSIDNKHQTHPNALGDSIRKGIEKVERTIDLM